MATLPASNTDATTKSDRQATGAQPDNTPVGGASTTTGPGTGVTSISASQGIAASASTGPVALTGVLASSSAFGVVKVDGTTITASGGVISAPAATPAEIYLSNYANLGAADTAAQAANATLVINSAVTIASSIAVTSPVRVTKGRFTINSGQVLTLNGGIEAPLFQIFLSTGKVQLNSSTKAAWPEWWGATHGTSADDGVAINAALLACWNTSPSGSATFCFANFAYYLQTTIAVTNQVPIATLPGASINPSGSTPAANGLIFGGTGLSSNWNYEQNINLPNFGSFSGTGLGLYNVCASRITFSTSTATIGVEFLADGTTSTGAQCLDNTVFAHFISGSGASAIKVTANGTGTVMQGNRVESNFIAGTKRWVYFAGTDTAPNNNANYFQADAVDHANVAGAISIDNSTGGGNNQNQFICTGFFGGFGGAGAKVGNGSFDQCSFEFGTGFNIAYANFGITEAVPGFGNEYVSNYGGSASTGGIAAATSSGSILTWNGGTLVSNNRIPLSFTFSSGLAVGSLQAFYVYSPYVRGNARMSFGCFGTLSNGRALLIEDASGNVAILTQLFDHSGSNANEIKLGFRCIGPSGLANGTVFTGTLLVGV